MLNAPITIGTIITFMFYSFFNSLARSKCLSFIIISIIIIILLFWDIFTQALAESFSLEFEWQHVFSSIQDTSQYSGRS